jgi:hypothetical protein
MATSRKQTRRLASLLCVLLLVSGVFADEDKEKEQDVEAQYAGLTYHDINTERIRFRLSLRLKTSRESVSLTEVRFEDLRANDLPLVVEPFTTRIDLRKGELVELPEPILVAVYFSELSSLDPVRQLLENRAVSLQGRVSITARFRKGILKALTFGQKLRRTVEIEEEVPFEFLESGLARVVAEQLLAEFSDPDSLLGTRWVEGQLKVQALVRRGKEMESGLATVASRFVLAPAAETDAEEMAESGVGFFVVPEMLVTTKQAVEPWKFDANLAFLRQSGYELRAGSYDVTVKPVKAAGEEEADGKGELRLSAKDWKFEERPKDEWEAVEFNTGDGTAALQLHRKETANSLVLLKVKNRDDSGKVLLLKPLLPGEELLVGISYFRATPGNSGTEPFTSWAVATATEEGVTLDRRFADDVAGAPVFDEKGNVRGIFVGGNRCLPIQAVRTLTGGKALFQDE